MKIWAAAPESVQRPTSRTDFRFNVWLCRWGVTRQNIHDSEPPSSTPSASARSFNPEAVAGRYVDACFRGDLGSCAVTPDQGVAAGCAWGPAGESVRAVPAPVREDRQARRREKLELP